MKVLRFPQPESEDLNEEDAVIRRWLKLGDLALQPDEVTDTTAAVPFPDRRTA